MSPETWARAKPLLQAALDRSPGPYRLQDVQDDLIAGTAQLWMGAHSAVVTHTEDEGVLHVWLYGGSLADMPGLFASAAAWAGTMGMDRMTIRGARKGWNRVLLSLGWERDDDAQMVCVIKEGASKSDQSLSR